MPREVFTRSVVMVVLVCLASSLVESSPKAKAVDPEAQLDAIQKSQDEPQDRRKLTLSGVLGGPSADPKKSGSAWVEMPLSTFDDLRRRLDSLGSTIKRSAQPAVVMAEGVYQGGIGSKGLSLRATLTVKLGRKGRWKMVPLAGSNVVLRKATDEKGPLSVTVRNGYHVWITRQAGLFRLTMDLMVPSGKGSRATEYDFIVTKTMITRFLCRFPKADLVPRIEGAIKSEIRNEGSTTLLDATLKPTARIRLQAFHNLMTMTDKKAKAHAETLSLISIKETGVKLFSVIRYRILYAGLSSFRIRIPRRLKVVSADGPQAFGYELEKHPDHTVLKGKTAVPVHGSYEISVHLSAELEPGSETFEADVPRAMDVEHEIGWIAVEVPGKLRIREKRRGRALPMDVRQMPLELVRSAVSAILLSYRYHGPRIGLELAVESLPEKEVGKGSIDRVHAFTVLSTDGRAMTELRITLRNHTRPALPLKLPSGASILSTLLDGHPVKVSHDREGRLILPLKRSSCGLRATGFRIQVSYVQPASAFGFFGRKALGLPSFDMPVSQLVWSLFLPPSNHYFRLRGDVEQQHLSGWATWRHGRSFGLDGGTSIERLLMRDSTRAETAQTGIMPVRIKLPKGGKRLDYQRYWVKPGHSVTLSFFHVRGFLLSAAAPVLSVLFFLLLLLAAGRFGKRSSRSSLLILVGLSIVSAYLIVELTNVWVVLLTAGAALLVAAYRRRWLQRAPAAIRTFWGSCLSLTARSPRKLAVAAFTALLFLGLIGGVVYSGVRLVLRALL